MLIVGPSNLGPYHQARYNGLVAAGVDLTVVACPVKEFFRPWSIRRPECVFKLVSPFTTGDTSRALLRKAKVLLREHQPDLVVSIGYNSRYVWSVSAACRLAQVPNYLYLVGWEQERKRRWSTEATKQVVCRFAFSGALVTGWRAFEYAVRLGIPQGQVWRLGNVVDNDHFACERRHVGAAPSFLYVGRFSPEKNLIRLIEAFAVYRRSGGEWRLRLAGAGPNEERVRQVASNVEGVEVSGWVSYEDLPHLLSGAGALVLPSEIEPWGLVVNEAMAAGLPVVVSRSCGCYPELCREGVNGFGCDPGSVGTIADALMRMDHAGRERRAAMGEASRTIIQGYGLEIWCSGFAACANWVARGRGEEGRVA